MQFKYLMSYSVSGLIPKEEAIPYFYTHTSGNLIILSLNVAQITSSYFLSNKTIFFLLSNSQSFLFI